MKSIFFQVDLPEDEFTELFSFVTGVTAGANTSNMQTPLFKMAVRVRNAMAECATDEIKIKVVEDVTAAVSAIHDDKNFIHKEKLFNAFTEILDATEEKREENRRYFDELKGGAND